jgi:uncharacterized protein YihD (DUF1040 family)
MFDFPDITEVTELLMKHKSKDYKLSLSNEIDYFAFESIFESIFGLDDLELDKLIFENYEISSNDIIQTMYKYWWRCKCLSLNYHDLKRIKVLLERLFLAKTYDSETNFTYNTILSSLFYKFYDHPVTQEMIELIRQQMKYDFPCKPNIIAVLIKSAKEACVRGNMDRFELIQHIYPISNDLNGYYYLLPYVAISRNVKLFDYIVKLQPQNIISDIIEINPKDLKHKKNYHTKNDFNTFIETTISDYYDEKCKKLTCE